MGFVGYSDMELLAKAIRETRSTDPERIAAYVKQMKEFNGKYEKAQVTKQGDIIIDTVLKEWHS